MNKKKFKNIAFVTWLFPKLSETFVLNQIVELKKLGYKISIFAVKDPRKNLAKEDCELERIIHKDIGKFRLLNLTKYGPPEELSSLIRKGIRNKKIDIVYFQFSDLAAEILKHGEIQCPTVSVFHDVPKACSKKEFDGLKKKYNNVFKKITIVLTTSEFSKNELIKLGCKDSKISIHHMGVDTNIFKPATSKSLTNAFNFIMVGRFVEKKGFIYGIRAFKKILEKQPTRKLKLSIVGDGILRETLEQEVKKLNIENKVVFLGKLPQKNIAKLLRHSNCFLCPSITTRDGKREGSPTTIMEAAACGVPVIATKHAGAPEILKDDCGILVKEKSVSELEKAMSKIIKGYSYYRKKFSKKARQLINEEHNIKRLVDCLLEIFNQAIKIEKQELAFKKFVFYIKKYLSSQVLSVIVMGSIARREKPSKESDVDILIVFKNQGAIPANNLLKLKRGISLLGQNSSPRLTPQIFDKVDLFQLLSPALIKSYTKDGKVIYGKNIIKLFKDKLSNLSSFELEMSILKRSLFERYLIREYITTYLQKPDYSFCYKLAKTVLFLARDFLFITEKGYASSREKIVKIWNKYYTNPTPSQALQVINHNYSPRPLSIFVRQSIDYIEKTTNKLINALKKKYPKKKIYIAPF